MTNSRTKRPVKPTRTYLSSSDIPPDTRYFHPNAFARLPGLKIIIRELRRLHPTWTTKQLEREAEIQFRTDNN